MRKKIYSLFLVVGIIVVLLATPSFWLGYAAGNDLEVHFFDVGQGDAIFIESPYGQNIIIDGGPDNSIIRELPKFIDWWDRKIDLMILTHPHDDHLIGLIEVIRRYKVGRILYTGVEFDNPAYEAWLEEIDKREIPLTIIDRPQTIFLGDGCVLEIIYPQESFLGRVVENLNNSSIVAELTFKDNSFLFTGDIEREVEEELLPVLSGAVDVYKSAHHGSDTSNSKAFLNIIRPSWIVVSVGKENNFGHPSRRVIKRFERLEGV
ncbi:MBL fold metallo-hydrolase, partial [bacterium]|nr:MBL fold metallo-hydrolase [bacterium]